MSSLQLKAGESLVYRALASDPDADPVTYSLVLNPPGMSVKPQDGTVVWTPTAAQVEESYQELQATRERLMALGRGESAPTEVKFDVAVRAADGKGGQALQYVEVTLVPPNHPPAFTSVPSNLQPQVGKRFEYRAVAKDADGDTVTYALKPGAPAGVTVNPTTGLVAWTPSAAQLGATSVTVVASDGRTGSAQLEVPLRVIEALPNRPPEITSQPRTTARTGSGYFYQLAATDPDGNPLTFSLVSKPIGMTVDPASGLVAWTPTATQLGPQTVSVSVSDGQGGTDSQSWSVLVSNTLANRLPSITSVPDTVTNLEKVYRYPLAGTDLDGDYLLWSLDSAPQGMVIDAQTGSLSWQPTPDQVGEHTVAVRVTDALGSYSGQEFSLKVTGVNTPPAIVSLPVTQAGVGQVYRYQAVGTDPENDTLRYSLGTKPEGMKIDAKTGAIEWTPGANAVGSHEVEVLATDTQGAVGSQKLALVVGTTAINQPPSVVSIPVLTASLGSPYSYPVQATDPEGGSLTYQLLQAPMGMTINPTTGWLSWANPTAGNHTVVVGATDAGGLGAAQGFTLMARANSAPIVPNVPAQPSIAVGATYQYDLKATDSEGDLLSYSLVQGPSGMRVDDEFGRVSWTPSTADVGTPKSVQIAITDALGKTVTVSYNLSVVADTNAPKIRLIPSQNTAQVGESVTFAVNAVDNVKVESLGLTINGTPVAIDAQGKATVQLTNLAPITAVATAKDAAGNVATTAQTVVVIDPTDVNSPTLNIAWEDDAEIAAPVNIVGTINDSNLAYYTLEIAPVGSSNFQEVYRGTEAVTNGTVATFDPTMLANGAYTLKFTAFDANGNRKTETRTVTTPNGKQTLVTQWDYDNNGKVRFVTDAENQVTEYQYDEGGNQIAVIDARHHKTEYRSDRKGQLVETIYPDKTLNNLADNPRTINIYDKGGRLRATIARDQQVTHYNYDDAGRLIWQEDANDNRTEFEYDKNGRRVAVELPLTQRSITTYDEVGNVKTVMDFNGDTITYSYDAENRLVSKEFAAGSGEVPVTFTYTADGQIKTIVDGRGTMMS